MTRDGISVFLCGDVMTGRGIDQVFPMPSKPQLYEPYVTSAKEYVARAERVSGLIGAPVDYGYIWGDALPRLREAGVDARIVNLETAVTSAETPWPGKEIHYRMHPANIACLASARIDCCTLANNHVLDWGYHGLAETLRALHDAHIATAGAGRNADEAASPAIISVPGKGRVLVFAFGMESAGVSSEWAAHEDRAGVSFLPDLAPERVDDLARQIARFRRAGDIVIVSVHWGGNWGYDITRAERRFAHRLIDVADVSLVHGHSSHHPKGIERYRASAILYGCGDFINDYEGIAGYESFRPSLTLMYLATFTAGGLERLTLVPMRIHRFSLRRADSEERDWMLAMLAREARKLGSRVLPQADGTFSVESE